MHSLQESECDCGIKLHYDLKAYFNILKQNWWESLWIKNKQKLLVMLILTLKIINTTVLLGAFDDCWATVEITLERRITSYQIYSVASLDVLRLLTTFWSLTTLFKKHWSVAVKWTWWSWLHCSFSHANHKSLMFMVRQFCISGSFLIILTGFLSKTQRVVMDSQCNEYRNVIHMFHKEVLLALCFSCCMPMILRCDVSASLDRDLRQISVNCTHQVWDWALNKTHSMMHVILGIAILLTLIIL